MKVLRLVLRLLPWFVCLLFVLALAFAFIGRIDRTIHARGEVRVQRYQVVRPQVSGFITEVLVEPGEQVRAGQALVRLSDYQFQRELLSVRQNLEQARARLRKEQEELRLRQEEIGPLERKRLHQEMRQSRLGADIRASQARQTQLELKRAREVRRQAEDLVRRGLVAAQELDEAAQAELVAEQRLLQSQLEERLARTRAPAQESELQLLEGEQRRQLEEENVELHQAESDVALWSQQERQFEELQRLQVVQATMDGVIISAPTSDLLNRYVRAGEELFQVIDVRSIQFISYVPEEGVLLVHSDQPALVEFGGVPRQHFKNLSGQVAKVSPFPEPDDKGSPRYAVVLQLEQPWVDVGGERFYLRSGMRGTAKISYRRDVPVLRALYELLAGPSL